MRKPATVVARVLRRLGFLSDVHSEAEIVAEIHLIHRRRAGMIVARFSPGNACLGRGLYVTHEDLDAALGLPLDPSAAGRTGPGAG